MFFLIKLEIKVFCIMCFNVFSHPFTHTDPLFSITNMYSVIFIQHFLSSHAYWEMDVMGKKYKIKYRKAARHKNWTKL